MTQYQLVIFDGDDTLWHCEELYDDARAEAARIVSDIGIDSDEWQQLQRELDIMNFETLGLSAERFPKSSVMAYEQLAKKYGYDTDSEIAQSISKASHTVFTTKARLMDGVNEVIRSTSSLTDIALLTKGDRVVQEKRIKDSGLKDLFDKTYITDSKSTETFEGIADNFEVDPSKCLSVGNSLPSDIEPALRAGMHAVWIPAHV